MSTDNTSPSGIVAPKDASGKPADVANLPVVVEKEGMIFKRGARMQRWSARFFVLEGHKLCYKAKKDTPSFKYQYDLIDGCVVTDIVPDVNSSGGKLYTFWIVWPGAKDSKDSGDNTSSSGGGDGDKSELVRSLPSPSTVGGEQGQGLGRSESLPPSTPVSVVNSSDSALQTQQALRDQAAKDQCSLKTIVEAERKNRLDVQGKVEQQIEAHHTYDNNTALGVKIAAAAVGGVVVGALTAGIGLIPYVTVVGVTALVSGGAVAAQSARRPLDSRIILATETLSEALSWKSVIEMQIAKVVEAKRPSLPSMHNITNNGSRGLTQEQLHQFHQNGYWRNVGYLAGGTRVQEHVPSARQRMSGAPRFLCFKTQLVIPNSPIKVFLALMDMNNSKGSETPLMWPPCSHRVIPACGDEPETNENFSRLVEVLDDHADIIAVSLRVKSVSDPPVNPQCVAPGAVGSTFTGLEVPDHAEERSYEHVPQLIERSPLYLNTAEPTGLHQDFDAEGNVEWGDLKTTYDEQYRLFSAPFRTYQSRDFWGRVQKELCCRLNGKIAAGKVTCKYPLRQFCLHRFWKLDDDGTYLITCTLTAHPEFPVVKPRAPVTATGTFEDKSAAKSAALPISVDTVITISPRKDADLYCEDVNECLVTCSVQTSSPTSNATAAKSSDDESSVLSGESSSAGKTEGAENCGMTGGKWVDRSECEGLMLEYLHQIIDLKHHIMYAKHRRSMLNSVTQVDRSNSFNSVQNSSTGMNMMNSQQQQFTTPAKSIGGDGMYELETPQSIGSSIMNSVPGTPTRGPPSVTPMKSKNRFAGTTITTQQPGLDDDELNGIAFGSPVPSTGTQRGNQGQLVTAEALSSQNGEYVAKRSSPSQSSMFSFRSKKEKEKEKEVGKRDRSGSNLSSTGSVEGGGSGSNPSEGVGRLSEYRELPHATADPHDHTFTSPSVSGRARTGSMARRRSSVLKRANPEQLNLRNTIQGKEYEIHRIDKMLRKLSSDQPRGTASATEEGESLRQFLAQQCKEYHELTHQYYIAALGEEYKPKSSVGKKLVKRGIVCPVVPAAPQPVATGETEGAVVGLGPGLDSVDMSALSGTGVTPSHSGGVRAHPTLKGTATHVKSANRWRNWFGTHPPKDMAAHGSSSSIDTLATDNLSADAPSSTTGRLQAPYEYSPSLRGSTGVVLSTSMDNLQVLGADRENYGDDTASTVADESSYFDRVPRCSRPIPKHWNHPLVMTHRTMLDAVKFNNTVQLDATSIIVVTFFALISMWVVANAQKVDWNTIEETMFKV